MSLCSKPNYDRFTTYLLKYLLYFIYFSQRHYTAISLPNPEDAILKNVMAGILEVFISYFLFFHVCLIFSYVCFIFYIW